jgi:hypothetical protein
MKEKCKQQELTISDLKKEVLPTVKHKQLSKYNKQQKFHLLPK